MVNKYACELNTMKRVTSICKTLLAATKISGVICEAYNWQDFYNGEESYGRPSGSLSYEFDIPGRYPSQVGGGYAGCAPCGDFGGYNNPYYQANTAQYAPQPQSYFPEQVASQVAECNNPRTYALQDDFMKNIPTLDYSVIYQEPTAPATQEQYVAPQTWTAPPAPYVPQPAPVQIPCYTPIHEVQQPVYEVYQPVQEVYQPVQEIYRPVQEVYQPVQEVHTYQPVHEVHTYQQPTHHATQQATTGWKQTALCPVPSGHEMDAPITVLLNGNVPVDMRPSAITVGTTTYPLPKLAENAQSGYATQTQIPGSSIRVIQVPKLTQEQQIALEKTVVAGTTVKELKKDQKGADKKGGKGGKRSDKKKGSSRDGAAGKRPERKKNGAAGVSALIALALVPIIALVA